MTFVELLQSLENRLGYQHLPLNPRATTIKQIFECSPVHHDLMHRLVQALYHTNACRQLTDSVTREASFEAVGPVRQNALKTATTDVDAYHLLDDFCHALDEAFTGEGAAPAASTAETKPPGQVIPLNRARGRSHVKKN